MVKNNTNILNSITTYQKGAQNLVIIGNGFDLHHGIRSSYAHFREWLMYQHPMLYKEFIKVYGKQVLKGEWWNDFEINLGNLDFVRFYKKCHREIPVRIWKEFVKHRSEGSGLPNSINWCPAGNRLASLYFILDTVMKQWVRNISSLLDPSNCIEMPIANTLFLTFNYTNILEHLYRIPNNQILHIHGSVENGDDLIFGHNESPIALECQYDSIGQGKPDDPDIQKIETEFGKKEKYPSNYMSKYSDFFQSLSQVSNVYAYGFSFSDLDFPYIGRIREIAPHAQWTISYYGETGKADILQKLHNNTLYWTEIPVNFVTLEDLIVKN